MKLFPAGAADDRGAALELARLKLVAADLEKLRKLADPAIIINNAQSAEQSLRGLAADKSNYSARFELAHSHILIALVLGDNNPVDAEPQFQSAIRDLNALINENGGYAAQPYWTQQLSLAQEYLGDLFINRLNNVEAARQAYDEARSILEQLQKVKPDAYGIKRDIAWAVNKQGDVQLRNRQGADALATFNDARDRLKQIETDEMLWKDPNWVNTLVIIDNNIALLQSEMGDYDAATSTLMEAQGDVRELFYHVDPDNLLWKGNLGWTLENAGWIEFLSAQGDRARLEKALGSLRGAAKIRNDLLARHASQAGDDKSAPPSSARPANPLWQSDADFTASHIAAVMAAKSDLDGDHCAAAQKFAEAAALMQKTSLGDGELKALLTMQLLDKAATAYTDAGDSAAAVDALTRAVDVGHVYLAATQFQKLVSEANAISSKLAGLKGVASTKRCAPAP
jgi:tetratricopeptide (TPR) repeat protein